MISLTDIGMNPIITLEIESNNDINLVPKRCPSAVKTVDKTAKEMQNAGICNSLNNGNLNSKYIDWERLVKRYPNESLPLRFVFLPSKLLFTSHLRDFITIFVFLCSFFVLNEVENVRFRYDYVNKKMEFILLITV